MGIYFNPGNIGFINALRSKIYIDKTGLLEFSNSVLGSEQRYICVSRPRRFGKSMAAQMLAAYYGRGGQSDELFQGFSIKDSESYWEHLNHYNVIFLNMQEFFSSAQSIDDMKELIERSILWDLLDAYPDFRYFDSTNLLRTLMDIYYYTKIPFVFIIDEWDCIFRESKEDSNAQKKYLDFLRSLLKDKQYVALAYMTGILPIKKYGSHSALNMFDEYSMTNPRQLAEYVGFTENEVKSLCEQFNMSFAETSQWYDGYCFKGNLHIYSPRSVVSAMLSRSFDNYWNQTETFEALRDYIIMDYKGLKSIIVQLLAGERKMIDTGTFTNDMTTFSRADDVLTLLIHLGYLGYNFEKQEIFIPNSEISTEFINAIQTAKWDEVIKAINISDKLLQATWNMDCEAVAAAIENVHLETSILTYNDENSLSCTLSLAYYSAKKYYMVIREMPTGSGFADLVYLPKKYHMDKPAILVELKWNQSAQGAINQIKSRKYVKALEGYSGSILLVGINYDKITKKHQCIVEKYQK